MKNVYRAADGGITVARLGRMLREKQLTVSTAESCTGGFIAHRLTLPAGASDYYAGSVVAYDNRVKEAMLHVNKHSIEAFGSVSREVAEQMAVHVAEKLKTDCSIAVSGVMGPGGGSEDKPVGTVWISTFYKNRTLSHCYHLRGEREENIRQTAEAALLQLSVMIQRKEGVSSLGGLEKKKI